MPNTLRIVLAILAGLVLGAVVNMLIVTISPMIIPPPPGVDINDPESLKRGIHLFETRHFIMPFLAHALGTLVGALTAYLIAANHKTRLAYVIGIVFLIGGVAASILIPAPTWFKALDIVVAYLPMAWLATQIGARIQRPA